MRIAIDAMGGDSAPGVVVEGATLAAMQRLQRFRGHYFNWYDTRDLRPLDPRYVSTVDSGNLAAHLLALLAVWCKICEVDFCLKANYGS